LLEKYDEWLEIAKRENLQPAKKELDSIGTLRFVFATWGDLVIEYMAGTDGGSGYRATVVLKAKTVTALKQLLSDDTLELKRQATAKIAKDLVAISVEDHRRAEIAKRKAEQGEAADEAKRRADSLLK